MDDLDAEGKSVLIIKIIEGDDQSDAGNKVGQFIGRGILALEKVNCDSIYFNIITIIKNNTSVGGIQLGSDKTPYEQATQNTDDVDKIDIFFIYKAECRMQYVQDLYEKLKLRFKPEKLCIYDDDFRIICNIDCDYTMPPTPIEGANASAAAAKPEPKKDGDDKGGDTAGNFGGMKKGFLNR